MKIKDVRVAHEGGAMSVLWIIIIVLMVMWGGGFAFSIGGGLIHLILVIALVLILVDFLNGRSMGGQRY
jgi:hypothetical protein